MQDHRYILLERQQLQPRPVTQILTWPKERELRELLGNLPADELVAFDTETKNTDATHPDFKVVGIGFASKRLQPMYIDLTQIAPHPLRWLKEWLISKAGKLTAYNSFFDASALKWLTGQYIPHYTDSYGLFRMFTTEGWTGQRWNLETFQLDVLGWDLSNKDGMTLALKERGLTKADMWQLPADILGKYCALDAEAALQAHEYLWQFAADKFPMTQQYHQREFMTSVGLLVEQFFRGMFVHQEMLHKYHHDLCGRVERSKLAFLDIPPVARITQERRDAITAKRMEMEPPGVTQQGVATLNWSKWKRKTESLIQQAEVNPNSPPQLKDLFFRELGYKPILFTNTGSPSTSKKVLPLFGEVGQALMTYKRLSKEEGYVRAMVTKTEHDGLFHPQFNSWGTVTSRLAGTGGLNLQQVIKTPGYLRCIRARPGHKLVQLDTAALEPVMTTNFSRDPGMWSLYGPDAKPNDVYLYVAAKIPGLGDEIIKHYDPDNPTKEGIAAAKKHCKRDRSVAKIVVLSATYGCGVKKMHETLRLAGFELSMAEVKKIHRAYWKLFKGVKRYGQALQEQWARNGGFFFSGRGLPICVDKGYVHDSLNRMIQASGHQFLQTMIYHIQRLRRERGVKMYPIISDFHDEVIWECTLANTEKATAVLVDALQAANDEWQLPIPIKGDPEIVDCVAEVKCEDYDDYIRSLIEDDEDAEVA